MIHHFNYDLLFMKLVETLPGESGKVANITSTVGTTFDGHEVGAMGMKWARWAYQVRVIDRH
jgi:hypothetical protein